MSYQKRQSAILEKAQDRLLGLQTIHPGMDFGVGLTLPDYDTLIASVDRQLQAYNAALVAADRARIAFDTTEATLSALSSRILTAVVAVYGKESQEYEMAGGVPPSQSKRAKKAAAATPVPPQSGIAPIVTPVALPQKATANGTAAIGL